MSKTYEVHPIGAPRKTPLPPGTNLHYVGWDDFDLLPALIPMEKWDDLRVPAIRRARRAQKWAELFMAVCIGLAVMAVVWLMVLCLS